LTGENWYNSVGTNVYALAWDYDAVANLDWTAALTALRNAVIAVAILLALALAALAALALA